MKTVVKLILIAFIIPTIFIACEKEEDDKYDNFYGSWIKTIIDSEGAAFTAELKINENNTFDFIIVVNNENNHTDSYAEFTLIDETMTIVSDADCDDNGVYDFEVSETILVYTTVNDPCFMREQAISGNWQRK